MVLAAYIRQHAQLGSPAPIALATTAPLPSSRLRIAGLRRSTRLVLPDRPDADVQAALTVLGRRTPIANENAIVLTDTRLGGVGLVRADLSKAWLDGANLSGASLVRVDLSGAGLAGVDLSTRRWWSYLGSVPSKEPTAHTFSRGQRPARWVLGLARGGPGLTRNLRQEERAQVHAVLVPSVRPSKGQVFWDAWRRLQHGASGQ